MIYYLLTFRHGRKKRNSVLIYSTPENMDLRIWHINWLHILWWWKWCEGECWQCQVLWVCYIDRLHICPMNCQEMLNLWNGLSGTSAVVDWKNIVHPMSFNAINAKNDLFIPGGIITYPFSIFPPSSHVVQFKDATAGRFYFFVVFLLFFIITLLPKEIHNLYVINLACILSSNYTS